MTSPTPSSLETAYRDYRGLLFSALGHLARKGFVVPPADALDLIHDFFVEAWAGLQERFDESLASRSTYVYAAFVRFARPRIMRLQRQRASLLDPAEVADLLEGTPQELEPADQVGWNRIGQAIQQLSASDRRLLDAWLNARDGSERDAARQLNVSRYEVRRHLIEVLGQIAASAGALTDRPSIDKNVALAVWRDGLTVGEAAARAGITLQQARNAYRRNQRRIRDALSVVPPARPSSLQENAS